MKCFSNCFSAKTSAIFSRRIALIHWPLGDSENVIFNLALLISIFKSSCDDILRWMPQDLTDNKSTLVQVMAWCRQATSHYLNQCWPRSPTPYGVTRPRWVSTLRPRQNGLHFVDIFKFILIQISLKFFHKGPIYNKAALVQIVAWRRTGDKPLSKPVCLLTPLCITRPQRVKPDWWDISVLVYPKYF